MDFPCDSHWDAVVHILLHVKYTLGKDVLSEDQVHLQIAAYTEAYRAGSPSD